MNEYIIYIQNMIELPYRNYIQYNCIIHILKDKSYGFNAFTICYQRPVVPF